MKAQKIGTEIFIMEAKYYFQGIFEKLTLKKLLRQQTNFMEKNPSWKSDSRSDTHEMQRFITAFTTRVYLSQMNPVHTFPTISLKIHSNICLPIYN